jgi:hypothetical protein
MNAELCVRMWTKLAEDNIQHWVLVDRLCWLQAQRSVRFLALPDFLSSSGYGMRSTKPLEYN